MGNYFSFNDEEKKYEYETTSIVPIVNVEINAENFQWSRKSMILEYKFLLENDIPSVYYFKSIHLTYSDAWSIHDLIYTTEIKDVTLQIIKPGKDEKSNTATLKYTSTQPVLSCPGLFPLVEYLHYKKAKCILDVANCFDGPLLARDQSQIITTPYDEMTSSNFSPFAFITSGHPITWTSASASARAKQKQQSHHQQPIIKKKHKISLWPRC